MHLKASTLPSNVDLVRTAEWFGSGRNAYREILISNRLATLILDNGWKGVDLKAVRLVEESHLER